MTFDAARMKPLVEGRDKWISAHYEGCEYAHVYCALAVSLREIARLQALVDAEAGF